MWIIAQFLSCFCCQSRDRFCSGVWFSHASGAAPDHTDRSIPPKPTGIVHSDSMNTTQPYKHPGAQVSPLNRALLWIPTPTAPVLPPAKPRATVSTQHICDPYKKYNYMYHDKAICHLKIILIIHYTSYFTII